MTAPPNWIMLHHELLNTWDVEIIGNRNLQRKKNDPADLDDRSHSIDSTALTIKIALTAEFVGYL